jgi:hypothetical protein
VAALFPAAGRGGSAEAAARFAACVRRGRCGSECLSQFVSRCQRWPVRRPQRSRRTVATTAGDYGSENWRAAQIRSAGETRHPTSAGKEKGKEPLSDPPPSVSGWSVDWGWRVHCAPEDAPGTKITVPDTVSPRSVPGSTHMGYPGLSNSRELAQAMCLVWNSDQSSKELGSW